jgi:hypothetical protein
MKERYMKESNMNNEAGRWNTPASMKNGIVDGINDRQLASGM